MPPAFLRRGIFFIKFEENIFAQIDVFLCHYYEEF